EKKENVLLKRSLLLSKNMYLGNDILTPYNYNL
ncbi:golgi organization and biogenesis factor, putative, partial [Plasmodium reichenowi]